MMVSQRQGMVEGRPNVVVVGGGFGGVNCVRALRRTDANVILVDRNNHALFQPLLYQVTTGVLTDSAIATPLRRIFEGDRHVTILRGLVERIDLEAKQIEVNGRTLCWDQLVIAAGMENNYFGREDWKSHAPGMKTLSEATSIRARILDAFEKAESAFAIGDSSEVKPYLTFAVVGGGATGVELAGAIKQLAVDRIAGEFKSLDVSQARVILMDGGPRLLSSMSVRSSQAAHRTLEKYGVEIRLNCQVTDVSSDGVRIGEEFIDARTVIWAAGVTGSPLANQINEQLQLTPARGNRVPVNPDLTVGDRTDLRVIGDLAYLKDPRSDKEIPGVAQGALQMGTYAGRDIARQLRGRRAAAPRPFTYFDKGMMATIGKGRAVLDSFGVHMSGFPAWVVWALIHIAFLINSRSRFTAIWSWSWAYVFNNGINELIIEPEGEPEEAEDDPGIPAAAPGAAG